MGRTAAAFLPRGWKPAAAPPHGRPVEVARFGGHLHSLFKSAGLILLWTAAPSGCAGTDALGPFAATAEWRLVVIETAIDSIDGEAGPAAVTARFTPSASDPSRGTVSGHSSCNHYSAGYSVRPGERLEVEIIQSTLMACPTGQDALQAGYYRHLPRAARYRLEANQLVIVTDEDTLLRFAPL